MLLKRISVATALTACGIETLRHYSPYRHKIDVATALTACGIETRKPILHHYLLCLCVATALTACGIETVEC